MPSIARDACGLVATVPHHAQTARDIRAAFGMNHASREAMACNDVPRTRRVALTGGPGAGKTAVLELVRRLLCDRVTILPESAGLLFGGGFPRGPSAVLRRAAQRAIFHVQRELEATTEGQTLSIVLCDRGTVDGGAYWPGPGELWPEVGTTRAAELARYDAVIHLRTPVTGYNHQNPLRTESDAEARRIDDRIAALWAGHPRRHEVGAEPEFFAKAVHAIRALRDELPECCRAHVVELVESPALMAHAMQVR
ncbi:MAG: ATP-binding protein [Deltaproteobacteria bacterium]